MFKYIHKLGLGTAQWGLDYGISNTAGKSSKKEVRKILELASSAGIGIIDTASIYGDSEKIIGKSNLNEFKIVTKTNPSLIRPNKTINTSFFESLDNLGLKKIYGLLLHNCDEIFSRDSKTKINELMDLKNLGYVSKIGFSAYNKNQILKALKFFKPDIIQLPFNVFDQSLLHDGTLELLKSLNIEIHARSSFLQGLLLMDISKIPKYFNKWSAHLEKWQHYCSTINSSPKSVALTFSASQKLIDKVIVGVENEIQLLELMNIPKISTELELKFLTCIDEDLINPSKWNF
ncbi:MAG: aldo/keto reductase [Prochlorococcus marinus CUG1431]|uniref:Aldo/keto reductase n=1 Tax=Prochlorococcus marinus CUG1433 TaxID=2774506 RepID=A0A9D9BWE7_PROMR|nr:aldo/keto reductase [Prochlorococcus marinus CUG1433]MBO6981240.1 aldo/keto reductase [Prochlorococcus marinus CUG1431]